MSLPNQLMIGRLKKEMNRMGVNARELSDMANVGRSFVYDILSGKSSNPTTMKISAIADALGVSVPYLIAGTSNDNDANEQKCNFIKIDLADIELNVDGSYFISTLADSESFLFSKEWIKNGLNTDPDNLRAVFIKGDSMEPSFYNDDMVIIDISQKEPNPPGIFVLFDGAGFAAKRLEYIRRSNRSYLMVKSDNPQYSSYECRLSELDIIGKVVWFSRRM